MVRRRNADSEAQVVWVALLAKGKGTTTISFLRITSSSRSPKASLRFSLEVPHIVGALVPYTFCVRRTLIQPGTASPSHWHCRSLIGRTAAGRLTSKLAGLGSGTGTGTGTAIQTAYGHDSESPAS